LDFGPIEREREREREAYHRQTIRPRAASAQIDARRHQEVNVY
jgi:hypothetical protein